MNGEDGHVPPHPHPVRELIVRAPEPGNPFNHREGYPGYTYTLAESAAETGFGPAEYWRTLRRRKGTVLLAAVLGLLGACLYTLPQTPVYQSRAVLEWQGLNENFLNMRDVNLMTDAGNSSSPEYDIQTQIRILESRSLSERVAAKLDLSRRPLVVKQDRLSAWRRALGLAPADAGRRPDEALAMAASNLRVRSQPNTRLILVSCDSTDPRLAAEFVTTLIGEYTEQNLESRWKTNENTGEWLARQMEGVKIKLEKSDEGLQAYARASGLAFTAEKSSVAEQRLRELQEELSRAEADRVAKQSKYETALRAAPESLPEVIDDGSLQEYQSKLAELRRQLAELTSSFTARHPKVKRVEAQISALDAALEKERANIVRRILNDFEAAQRREQLLRTEYSAQARLVSEQADKVTHYNILKREVDTNRQLYDAMLQRVKEAGVASALRASNVRIVDPAKAPRAPYKPDVTANSLLGMLTGFLAGAAFVVMRERADRSLHAPGDAQTRLGIAELGVIPSGPPIARRYRFPFPRHSRRTVSDFALVTWERGCSPIAESFRAVVASMILAGENGSKPRVVVVSSANAGEGKTTVAVNLAIALSEINQRVLLIDADLRKPSLHEIFCLDNQVGLTGVLTGRTAAWVPSGAMETTHIPGLQILPGGCSPDRAPRLLYSPRMGELLRSVRLQFDTVLIDTPPVLPMADARVVARLADSVVLVVRANKTTREAAALACQRFTDDGTVVLGAVLNDWS
jgi:capsular exopolysaccharide synthesis family protein